MRAPATIAMLALLAACRNEAPRPEPPVKVAAPAVNEAAPDPPQSDNALASMSPGQRRAYDRGLADCRAGRYAPANHPEAYRIGCAEAHDAPPPCLQVGGDATLTLEGRLSRHIFPGPPNYEDVRRGDEPETTYILTLPAPICIDDGGESADPDRRFDRVHLYTVNEAVWPRLRAGVGQQVRVQGRGFAEQTGHHHAPLVVDVSTIRIEGR
jgi:uncharacterized protein DUF4431